MKNLIGRPFLSVTARSFVFMPSLVRPIRRPGAPFSPQARGRAVRLRVDRVDHDRLVSQSAGRQTIHHLGKDSHGAPTLSPIVERLMRPIFPRSIPPAQPIAVDEDNPAQHTPVINTRSVMAPWEKWLQTRHLLVRQPIQSPQGA